MRIRNQLLIEELRAKVQSCREQAQSFQALTHAELTWRENEGSWSMLECVEHLNLYGDFYLPEIEKRIAAYRTRHPQPETAGEFKYNRWGNFFVKAVAPKPEAELNKMKAFKKLNPISKALDHTALTKFIDQQDVLLALLAKAEFVNLNKIKTNSTIPFVRLKLGDTLRAEVYHNQRHIAQAQGVLRQLRQA